MRTDLLKMNRAYPIEYRKKSFGFFHAKKQIELSVDDYGFDSFTQNSEAGSDVKSHLNILGVRADKILGYNFIKMREWHHTEPINLYVYLVNDGLRHFRVLKIMDICIKDKFQNLGIGSQVLRVIEEISEQNSVKCIFGVLEKKGNLERRKNFYVKNCFQLKENSRFGLSNICAVKFINTAPVD